MANQLQTTPYNSMVLSPAGSAVSPGAPPPPAFVGCISGSGGNLRDLKATILQDLLYGALDTDAVVVNVDPRCGAHGCELKSTQPWPISELQGVPPANAPA